MDTSLLVAKTSDFPVGENPQAWTSESERIFVNSAGLLNASPKIHEPGCTSTSVSSGHWRTNRSAAHPSFVNAGSPPPNGPDIRTTCPSRGPIPNASRFTESTVVSSDRSRAILSPERQSNTPRPCEDATNRRSVPRPKPTDCNPPIPAVPTKVQGSGTSETGIAISRSNVDCRCAGIRCVTFRGLNGRHHFAEPANLRCQVV